MKTADFFIEFGMYPVGLAGRVGDGYFMIEMLGQTGRHRKIGINMSGADVGEDSDDFISADTYVRMLRSLPVSELHKFHKSGPQWEPISRFALEELSRRHKSKSVKSVSSAKSEIKSELIHASQLQK